MEHPLEQSDKIKKNAISAYLMIFVSVFFLANKTNPLLANDFVKSHTRTAFMLHLSFLVVTLIFLWFGLFDGLGILGIPLNNIVASTLLLGLFGILLYGIHKAHKGEYFTIVEVMHLTKTEKIVGISSEHTLDEKDKLSIILSYIPFIGYIVYGMHAENKIIENITKINILSSSIIALIFAFGHLNVSLLLTLGYIVFVVFSCIILVGKNEVLSLNLDFIPNLREIENHIIAYIRYLKGYFNKKFTPLDEIYKEVELHETASEQQRSTKISELPKYPLHPLLVYVPVVNLFHIFYHKNSLHFHIVNGISISIFFIISWIVLGFDNTLQVLLVFPIFFGLAHLYTKKTYLLPIIAHIGTWCVGGVDALTQALSSAKKLSKKKEETTLKPEEKK